MKPIIQVINVSTSIPPFEGGLPWTAPVIAQFEQGRKFTSGNFRCMIEHMKLHEVHTTLFEKRATEDQNRLYVSEKACGFLSTGTDEQVLATVILAIWKANGRLVFIVPEFRQKRITSQIEKAVRAVLGRLNGKYPKTAWEVQYRLRKNILIGHRTEFEKEPDRWVACGFSQAEVGLLPDWAQARLV